MSYRSRFDDPYPRSRGDERGGRSNDDGRGRPVEDRYRDYPPNSAPRRSRSPGTGTTEAISKTIQILSGSRKITETENDGKQGDRHQSRFTDFLALAKNSELAQEFTELRKNYVAEQSRLRINGTFVDQDRLRKNYVAEQARLRQKIQDLSESKKIMEGDADGRKEKAQSRFALRKSLRENGTTESISNTIQILSEPKKNAENDEGQGEQPRRVRGGRGGRKKKIQSQVNQSEIVSKVQKRKPKKALFRCIARRLAKKYGLSYCQVKAELEKDSTYDLSQVNELEKVSKIEQGKRVRSITYAGLFKKYDLKYAQVKAELEKNSMYNLSQVNESELVSKIKKRKPKEPRFRQRDSVRIRSIARGMAYKYGLKYGQVKAELTKNGIYDLSQVNESEIVSKIQKRKPKNPRVRSKKYDLNLGQVKAEPLNPDSIGYDRSARSRSPISHSSRQYASASNRDEDLRKYISHSESRTRSPPRSRSTFSPTRVSSSSRHSAERSASSWKDHNPQTILEGTVKEFIDDFTGLMEVEYEGGGGTLTAFFHATAIWVVNPAGNPYGPPVKFMDVLGQNTATTRENTNVSLKDQAPVGAEVLLLATPVLNSTQSDVVQLIVLSAWPKSTEAPPTPKTENEQKILEKKQEYFLKEFHNKLENQPAVVEASFPGCIPALYPDIQAKIWEIIDEEFGIIEVQGERPRCRFLALFHKNDVWLRDGKQGCKVDFFKQRPLKEMCKVGQPVNLIARSILVNKGSDLTNSPGIMDLQAVIVSLNPGPFPLTACRPTWCPGRPGVFAEPTRYCRFFRTTLFDELNIKLKKYIMRSGKKLPNLDPNFFSDNNIQQQDSMMQVKQERYENYQQQQNFRENPISVQLPAGPQTPDFSQPPPTRNQVDFPKNFNRISGRVFQHVGNMGRDAMIIEDVNKQWKCLGFKETCFVPGGIHDLKVAFPTGYDVVLNAELVNPDKPIQYIANLVWRPQHSSLTFNMPNMRITDLHYTRYFEVLNTVGRVLDTVAKLPISGSGGNKQPQQQEIQKFRENTTTSIPSNPEQLVSKIGTVYKILDDNFGLIKLSEGIALFDTCDYWLGPEKSAAAMSKTLEEVLKIGMKVQFHACLMDKRTKIQYLATAVWLNSNIVMQSPANLPPAIKKSQINDHKIDIYQKVVTSVADSLKDELPGPPTSGTGNGSADHQLFVDPAHVIPWEHAKISSIIYDKNTTANGGIVAGIARISQFQGAYGFFMSRNFIQHNAVPSIGMEEYVTMYPISKLSHSERYGSFSYFILALYPPFMSQNSGGKKDVNQIRTIVQESSALLAAIMDKYPALQNVEAFINAGPLNSCILQIDSRLGLPPPPNAVVSAAATISTNLGVPPTADSRPALADTQVSVNSAFLRCMISHERGILMSERDHGHPPKICYFEIDDLNIEKPIDVLDMTMLLNRMEGIKVQFQARIVDENAPIPYVANKNGVQILGDVPSYMHKIRLKKPRPSKVSISEFSEKIDRYKDAVSKFKKGQIITISEMLTQAKQMRNFRQCKGVVVSILNENFGLVEVKGFFALFDTFDLYLSHGTTAAESNKGIEDCVRVGEEMLVNACLIDENLPITHLATALHSNKHKDLKMEAPLTKEQILDNKINVYEQVAKASAVVIEKLMASKDQKVKDVNKIKHYENYEQYNRIVSKESRGSKDPDTPNIDIPTSIREWDSRVSAWKNNINTWAANYKKSTALLREPSVRDHECVGYFDSEVNDNFALIKISSTKKAFIHVNRLWIYRKPLFGGWKALQRIPSNSFAINARQIPESVEGVQYQATFAHTGIREKDYHTKKFVYPREMEDWIEKIVTLDKLNEELKEFKHACGGK